MAFSASTDAQAADPPGRPDCPEHAQLGGSKDRSSHAGKLLDTVVAGGYCVGCGACASVEGSPLRMRLSQQGTYLPELVNCDSSRSEPASIIEVCPFFDTDLNEDTLLPGHLAIGAQRHPDVGYYRNVYAGFASERNFREMGSSGGLTNWLAAELLETGAVDGVVHVRQATDRKPGGLLFEYGLSTSPGDLASGAKSRYYPVEMSAAVRMMREKPGRYAVVGVPCFIKAIRLLCRTDPIVAERVRYCIALFCGHLKSTSFAEHAGWQLGVHPSELVDFDFRTKVLSQPANRYSVTAVGLRGVDRIAVTAPTAELTGSDWGEGFFKLQACDYCDDIVGETADISLGDAWLPELVGDRRGTNIVVTRSREIEMFLQSAANAGRISLQSISVQDVRRSQRSNYRHRRDDLAYRLWLTDQEAKWRPRKRTPPSASDLSPTRQEVARRRMALREITHRAYCLAKSSDKLAVFDQLTSNPVNGIIQG